VQGPHYHGPLLIHSFIERQEAMRAMGKENRRIVALSLQTLDDTYDFDECRVL
jgi:hypothetical protein